MPIFWLWGRSVPLVVLVLSVGLWGCGDRSAAPDTAASESGPAAGEVGPSTSQPGASGGAEPESDGDRVDPPGLPAVFPAPGSGHLEAVVVEDLDDAFRRVARGIRYEPYAGVLRGAAGTLLAGAGNDIDQALLLAELLQRAGYRTRFVRGTLGLDNQLVLLRGMTSPVIPELQLSADYLPWDPGSDEALLSLTRDHVWVEVFQGDDWLPLDPSFPRAEPGEAYARAESWFDAVPAPLHQRVRISYHEETREDGERELGVLEGTAAELGLRPLSLVVHAVPQSPAGPVTPGGTPGGITGGIAGALGGGRPEEAEPDIGPDDIVGLGYRRTLRGVAGESRLPTTFVVDQERNGGLVREWLEIETTAPGQAPVRTRRVLFDAAHTDRRPAEPRPFRRYSISVVPGPVQHGWLREERDRWRDRLDVRAWRGELESAAMLEAGPDAADAARRLADLEAWTGTAAGHLLALSYAAESDSISRLVAGTARVVPVWYRPRVLITSLETMTLDPASSETTVSLDLRIDDIDAYPLPGAPSRAPRLFRMARGLQNSVLEGAVVARATGVTVPVTTAGVMERADEELDDGLVVVSADARDEALARIEGLPDRCGVMIQDALDRGVEVIIPRRAVRLAGRDRWGWWELDPGTGALVGVMEDGQHQGMTEYKLNLKEVGLNDRMGWGIGAIVGATGTLFTISALLLEYGEDTDEMVAEVVAMVHQILCRTCVSKAEAKAGHETSVSIGGDCFKQAVRKDETGAAVQVSFCDQYEKGFKCTSGLLLASLTGKDPSTGAASEVSGSLKLGCEEWKVGAKADDGGVETQVGDRKSRVSGG